MDDKTMDHAERVLGPLKEVDDQILGAGRRVVEDDNGRTVVTDTYYLEKSFDGRQPLPHLRVTDGGKIELAKILSIMGDGTYHLKSEDACLRISMIDGDIEIDSSDPDVFDAVREIVSGVSFGKYGVN